MKTSVGTRVTYVALLKAEGHGSAPHSTAAKLLLAGALLALATTFCCSPHFYPSFITSFVAIALLG